MTRLWLIWLGLCGLTLLAGCGQQAAEEAAPVSDSDAATAESRVAERLSIYAPVQLTADLSGLTDNQKKMLPLLVQASDIMDDLYWLQAYGERDALLAGVRDDATRRFAEINYGPWDRLDGDRPFIDGVGAKPPGANFYPPDMTREEFDAADLAGKDSLYTLLRREGDNLVVVPYHVAYRDPLDRASNLLKQAAEFAEDKGFRSYLLKRAHGLESDEYQPSDLMWMDVKNNAIELVIGPIETYEDALFGYKAAYESYVLLNDLEWSERLSRFATFLPELQRGLPVPEVYKREQPGSDSDLNAYDVIYYAGHSNAGAKTIAINLPNDEEVQLRKGTRRLQLKNAMRAKFDKILLPIADELIAADQRQHVTFDAFFANTMFHEVAHGLGIKNTINGRGTVREALKEHASSLEEGKADILGLYMITALFDRGEITDVAIEDNYVTFLAGIFRSVRFGASSAHGKANMIRFNFFKNTEAFTRDEATGAYSANIDRMREAITALSRLLLTLQGDGDYSGARQLVTKKGVIGDQLAADLERLAQAGIPVDIVFEQGLDVLGLQ